MNIEKNEVREKTYYVGVEEMEVLAFSPNRKELNNLLNYTPDEPQEEIEYVKNTDIKWNKDGEEQETKGVTQVQIDVWMRGKETGVLAKTSFFIAHFNRLNKDGEKHQYINQVGDTSWTADVTELKEMFTHFTKKDFKTGKVTDRLEKIYRKALIGEEQLYAFLISWMDVNKFNEKNDVFLDNKKLFKGNFSELNSLIEPYSGNTVMVALSVKDKDITAEDETTTTKRYQVVENRYFCPGKYMRQFRIFDGRNEINTLKESEDKKLYSLRKFVNDTTNEEHGIKNFFTCTTAKEFIETEFFAAGEKVSATSSDY